MLILGTVPVSLFSFYANLNALFCFKPAYTECTRYARFSVSCKGALTPPLPQLTAPSEWRNVYCLRC
uniref:Uncharacterized protein n=3 Tax=Vibrio TaxID=662 RepID=A0A0H3ZTY8_9VIBR|nr:hypothetical protein [Vibrio sp. ZF_53]AKN36066.1 hypothetical protein [Vibrio sp. ZF_53]AKN37818.1 hypothetical protein [Vibrio sp. ZF_45]AKN39833.1 hypothetical protein [Vibrio tasmaniensis]